MTDACPGLLQAVLVDCARVIPPPIRMMPQSWSRLPLFQSPVQGCQRQGRIVVLTDSPADALARVAIHQRGQIATFLLRLDLQDIADPGRMRSPDRCLRCRQQMLRMHRRWISLRGTWSSCAYWSTEQLPLA